MISLLLTLFICVFSYCPFINRLEVQKENTIIINEETPVKNFGYLDEYGVQLYMFNSDLLSNDFIVNFIVGIAGDTGSIYNDYSFISETIPVDYIDFDCSSYFMKVINGYVDTNEVIYEVRAVRLQKTNATYNTIDGEPYLFTSYRISFISGYDFVLQIEYYLVSPLYDSSTHDLGGVSCIRSYISNDRLTNISTYWCYHENTLELTQTPLISYFYNTIQLKNITIINERFNTGYELGHSSGYQEGYQQALDDTEATESTALTIFTGILSVAMLPVNIFLEIFNFEVFGINISGLVSALLTVAIVIIIARFLLGGKSDDK